VRARGFTLVEMLVAVFLAVNVFGAVLIAYTTSVRYLSNARSKQTGNSNGQMALNFMEKELHNVACTETDPAVFDCSQLPYDPLPDNPLDTGETSSQNRLFGIVRLPGSYRVFCFCRRPIDNTLHYVSNSTLASGSCVSDDTSCPSAWQTVASNIQSLAVTRPSPTTVRIRVTVSEGTAGATTLTRDFRSSVHIAGAE